MGSAAIDWIVTGFQHGDPVATALFMPLFLITGLVGIMLGQPF